MSELTPDPLLRRFVVLAGLAATVLGLAMILLLPVAPHWRALAGLVWLATSIRDVIVIAKGHERCLRIRIAHDGRVDALAPDGCWFGATLLAGSMVFRRIAWLRFEADNGQRFAELIRGKSPQDKDWRRLQVIWRHLGAGP